MTEQENADHAGTCMYNCLRMNSPLSEAFLDAAEAFAKTAGLSGWCRRIVLDAAKERRAENRAKERRDDA